MIEVLALVAGHLAGLDLRRLAILAGALFFPIVTLAVVAFVVWKQDRGRGARPAIFCDGVAAELRSGANLRDALASAASSADASAVAKLAQSGAPLTDVAASLREEYPSIGHELELTVAATARTGSRGADLFDEIGSLAIAQDEVEREVRIATAPARATAAVFLLAPAAYLLFQARSGTLSSLFAAPGQRTAAILGLSLFLAGMAAAAAVVWRSR